jgi:hypothetical protein
VVEAFKILTADPKVNALNFMPYTWKLKPKALDP